MECKARIIQQIEYLDQSIKESPDNYILYMERGKLHHRICNFDRALNDFVDALEMKPENPEAKAYIELIREILSFHYAESYNP